MRKHARRKVMAEINVVPYIDVTLVLLIIFMITTPLLQTGVDVELPQAQSKPFNEDGENDKPPLIISIKEDGSFFLNSDGQTDEPLLEEEIKARVVALFNNDPSLQVLINADKRIDYGTVVVIMAELKNAGVPNVGLMTDDK